MEMLFEHVPQMRNIVGRHETFSIRLRKCDNGIIFVVGTGVL